MTETETESQPLKTPASFDFSRFIKPTTKARDERSDLVGQFQARINQERVGTSWRPISARAVAVKLGHIPTADLYAFLKMCERGPSFGKVFWGALKIR